MMARKIWEVNNGELYFVMISSKILEILKNFEIKIRKHGIRKVTFKKLNNKMLD